MQEEAINILIVKSLRDECSPAERAALDRWLAQSADNKKHYDEIALIEKQMAQMDFGLEPRTSEGWADLQSRITKAPQQAPVIRRSFSVLRIAVAAVVVIAMVWAATHFLIGTEDTPTFAQRYHVPAGQTQEVTLEDGSLIILNAGSELQIADNFNQKERRVRLSGEGFFEIAKDASKTFLIESGNLRTEVLGTAFRLSAYPDDSEMRIAVVEGKVRFSVTRNKSLTLTPGQGAVYTPATGELEAKDIRQSDVMAWKQRELVFSNTPFSDVINELERRFDVVISDQAGLSAERLSSRFGADASLQEVLAQLELLYELEVDQNGKDVVLKRK